MKKFLLFLFIVSFAAKCFACSSFFFNSNSKIFAKNFDWTFGDGYILKNQKNKLKFTYGFRSSNVASWTSKFGSITFNQIGKEFPYGGINERGLVVEQLWFSSSQYQDNHSQEISELEWIQYQLDNYQNVDEVIQNINLLTIKPITTIHYMIADKLGNSAVIEFVDGKVKVDKQNSKFQVITNESSEDSKKYFELNKIISPESRTHFDRFCILENNLKKIDNVNVNDAFKILNSVKEDNGNYKTYWSIVYDLEKAEIHFKSFGNPVLKKISISDFDFNSPCEFSNINADEISFKNYTSDDNYKLLSSSIKKINKSIDLNLANAHQMNPEKIVEDEIYQKSYIDLSVDFLTKKESGNLYFMFTKGNLNDGFLQGISPITKNSTKKIFYGFPKGEFALKCFQDLDFNGKIDRNLFGIPIRTGFSNNKKKIFGIQPNYETAKVSTENTDTIQIRIN